MCEGCVELLADEKVALEGETFATADSTSNNKNLCSRTDEKKIRSVAA
jgi:hypothetical protein